MVKFYVIYKNPSDFPGKYVIREQWALTEGRIAFAEEPHFVGDTLEDARRAVSKECFPLGRSEYDDPVIVETWMA